jgi:hypothetical protein
MAADVAGTPGDEHGFLVHSSMIAKARRPVVTDAAF